jgi:hypothetical protein
MTNLSSYFNIRVSPVPTEIQYLYTQFRRDAVPVKAALPEYLPVWWSGRTIVHESVVLLITL